MLPHLCYQILLKSENLRFVAGTPHCFGNYELYFIFFKYGKIFSKVITTDFAKSTLYVERFFTGIVDTFVGGSFEDQSLT